MKEKIELRTFAMMGKTHVLAKHERQRGLYPDANFMGTGMALVGILKNETLEQFRVKWVARKLALNKIKE
jgi:hypothetical protein